MRALTRSLALVLTTGAALAATGGTAGAATCVGTANTAVVCEQTNKGFLPRVDPNGSSYDDCIYLGGPPCTPVSVPIPTVERGTGLPVTITCSGPLIDPILTCR